MTTYIEEDFTLPTKDGKKIYGSISKCAKTSGRVVIISHGLTGYPGEYLSIEARKYFNANNYDLVRFAYYSYNDDARNLVDCTLKIHADDLNQVCEYFSQEYEKLFVSGHSYGGLSLIFANPKATALSFWDSSFTPYEGVWKNGAKVFPNTIYYTIDLKGCRSLIGQAMYDEAKNLTKTDSIMLAKQIITPSQVILAESSDKTNNRAALYEALMCQKEIAIIKNADHKFTRGETAKELLTAASSWFDKF